MPAITFGPSTVVAASLASNLKKPTKPLISFTKLPSFFKPLNPTATFTTFRTLTPIKSSATSDSTLSDDSISARTSYFKALKYRLRNGETLYGMFLLSFCPTLAEIASFSSYDFVVVDMEHGPGGITEALSCLRALTVTQTPAIIRLPESCPTWAKKALDLGPKGIMFPMIESAKMAKKAVSYCRFPPAGIRGSAHPVVRASNYGIDEGYLSNYEGELLSMCQVESEERVKKQMRSHPLMALTVCKWDR